ncbi:MAG: hypothetical protein AAGE52_34790 [Myxococcota bacterium]
MSTSHKALSGGGGFDGDPDEGEKLGAPIDPARLARRARLSKWWILGAIVVGAMISLPVAKFAIKRNYKSTAMLRYEGVPEIEGLPQAQSEEQDLGSKLQAIFIDSVLTSVKERLAMEEPTYVVGQLIEASSDPAQVVRVSASATEADRAAIFANTVVDVFLEHQVTTQRERIQAGIDSLDERIAASEQTLGAARQSYDTFRDLHGIADLSTEQEQAIESAADLRAQRDRTESEIGALEARIEQLRRELRRTPRTTVQSSTVMASAEAGELRRLEAELAQVRANLSDDHPRVLALRQQISTLRERITSGDAKKLRTATSTQNSQYTALQAAVVEAQADLEAARQRLQGLTTLAQQAQERVEQFSSIEGEATGLLAEVRVNERLLTELQTQKARMQDALRDPTHGFVVMSEATAPEFAERSKKKYIVAAGIPMVLLILVLIGLLVRELKGARIQTANEAAFWGKAPVIGSSVWPRQAQAIDDLIADMDDYVPDATGEMLVVAATDDCAELALQFAGRLNSDWYDTTLVGGSPFDHEDDGTPSLPPPAGGASLVPFTPHPLAHAHSHGQAPARAHHIDMSTPMQMTVQAWEGPTTGPALRRAARLADRVCVLLKAQSTSIFDLRSFKTRLGRVDGVGIIVLNVPDEYVSLADRVGPVDEFWAARRE